MLSPTCPSRQMSSNSAAYMVVVRLKHLATKVRTLNALLKQWVKFNYTADIGRHFQSSAAGSVSAFCVGVFRTGILLWCATVGPSAFCSDACIDGSGTSLEQEQLDGSVRLIAYISRATLPAECNWTVLDLETGGIIWAIKRLRGHIWSSKFAIYSDHKTLESTCKAGEHNA